MRSVAVAAVSVTNDCVKRAHSKSLQMLTNKIQSSPFKALRSNRDLESNVTLCH